MRNMTALLFSGLLLFSLGARAEEPSADATVAKALALKLDERKEWRRLLHYMPTLFGGFESQADGASFFVHPKGKHDPKAELEATVRGFFDPTEREMTDPKGIKQSVRCQFPARWTFLSKELGLTDADLPPQKCERYHDYVERLEPGSVTLIFSSYYTNNPGSTFGHTLLRLNRKSSFGRTGSELVDAGVNYAANAHISNPVLYAIYGVAGGFDGVFTVVPYYYKVREYNDFESRDLWEYDLALTQEEVNQVVNHMWELLSSRFDYYYLTENCSYHMLTLLDAAAPRLDLESKLHRFVIPIDTVKALFEEPGLVTKVRMRPSLYSQLASRLRTLSGPEHARFEQLRAKKSYEDADAKDLDPDSAARVLDAVADAIDLDHAEALYKKDPAIAAWKQNLLIARSRLPMHAPLVVETVSSTRPDQSHASSRFAFGGGSDASGSRALQAQFRFSLHDLLDPMDGYPAQSSVEMGRITGRYLQDKKEFTLQNFRLFSVAGLKPIDRIEQNTSFLAELGADRVFDKRCEGCLAATGSFLSGATVSPFKRTFLFALVGPEGSYADGFRGARAIASGLAPIGVRTFPVPEWSLMIKGEYARVFDREPFDRRLLTLGTRYTFSRLQGLETEWAWQEGYSEGLVSYFRFY